MKFSISDPCVEARGCCCCCRRSLTAILQPVPWDLLLAWLGKYWKTAATRRQPQRGRRRWWRRGGDGGVRSRQILPSNPPFTPRWTSFAFHPASMSSPSLTTQGRWNRGPGGPGESPPAPQILARIEAESSTSKGLGFWVGYYPRFSDLPTVLLLTASRWIKHIPINQAKGIYCYKNPIS